MAAFTNAALNTATQERDAKKEQQKIAALSAEAKQAQKQYGDIFADPVGLSGAQSRGAEQTWTEGETARREAAATGAYDIGKTIDTRKGNISDATQAALQKLSNANVAAATSQRQTDQEDAFAREQAGQQVSEQYRTIDFASYKSITDRSDALAKLYFDGQAEKSMIQAQAAGKLKLFDVQKYYKIQMADLTNMLKDMQGMNEMQQQLKMEEIRAKVANGASVIGGLSGIATGIMGAIL